MARTFTISFTYNGGTYMAVISPVNDAINIYVPDESLHDILPYGKATYHPSEGLEINRLNPSAAQNLILNILTSIEKRNPAGLSVK